MAEHLRNALRDFALQKMRDLEAERTTKSKKDEDSASKSRKPTKIKINRDISKAISGPSKNPDKPQLVTSDSKKSTKRHHEESTSGDKITKLMKLYQEDATAVISAAGKEGSVSVKSYSEESECKRTTDPSMDEHSVQEQGGKKTVKHSGWKVVKEEPPTAKPQFKSLSSIKKPESDVGEGAEKKSVPMLSDKKPIQIKIQTKLLALPQETEIKVETKESDSESDSSNDDESDDSDDENTVIDGLPWRTILEDGELTPSSSEEEEKADGDGEEVKGSDEVKGEGEVKSEGQVKGKKDKEEKALDNTGEAKKKSSKHKHKSSKHKKHKHKSKKKKKSKHKHKDKKEKDSTSDSNKDGRISSEKEKDEVKDAGVSASETIDIKGKREKTSSSRRASKDDEQKEGVSEDRKVHRSSSSSRKTSEEREARGSTQERITKEDAKKIKQTEEGKERHRSHSKSRSSSKEKSHTEVVTEDKVTRKEDISEKMTEGKYQSRVNEEEERRHKEKSRQRRERHSSGKDSRSERRKESKKSEEDKTCVPSSDKLERGGSKEKHTIVHKEQCNDAESNDQTNSTKPLPEKKMTIETDFKDGSRTIKESVKSTGTKAIDTVSKDTKTIKTEMDGKRDKSHKNDKQTHEERTIKEEKIQKDDTRKESRRKDDRKDGEKEKSRHEESSRREKRHREKGKDKEDKKRHSSKKHQITSKVKIDHLEHDFPSAEEYADDSGDKVQTEMKGDVSSKISVLDKYNSSGIQATLSKLPAVAASPLDNASTELAGKGKVKMKEDRGSLEDTKTLKGAPSVANVSTCSTNQAKAEKSEVAQEEGASHDDKKIADSVTVAPAKQEEHIGETKDSTTSAKKLEGSSGKSEDDSKLGKDIIGDVESLKASETTETTLVDSESAGRKIVAADKKEDAPSTGNNEKDAVSSTSATVKPVQKVESSEKKVDSKVPEKATEKDSKKRKKEKEEGAIDSEIEEGEITKKHKKSKKKDKKKDRKEDRKEKDKKDRTDRDKSEHRDRDRKSKRRHSEVHSELRSHSRSSQKKHKGSRSKSPSEGDGDSDISIGKTKMVEKSFFSESRGCWVTQMVPKEEDGSSSSGHEDGNEPYDIGDTYIRYPPHDRRSVFDRLGGGSSGARGSSRERFNERYDRRSGYGYRRRRGRSYSRSRSRSRSRSPSFRIDKKKLLEIAKANALQRMRAGDLPANLPIPDSMKKAADTFEVNESIQKFTERCKALANLHGGSSDDDSPVNRPIGSDDEDDETQKTFVRHPFKVKEAAPIVMNIRNAVQIPVVGKEKLRTQFPVSSGSQHRRKEEEIIIANANDPYGQWTTVEKEKPDPAAATATPPTTKASTPQPPPPPSTAPPATTTTPTTPATTATAPATTTTAVAPVVGPVVAGPHIPGVTNIQPPQPVPEKDKVFEDAPEFAYDIGQIVSARLKAARSLQSNPHNVEALTVLHHSQKQIQTWAHSSKKPGLFTGSTDATFLRPEQLSHPNRKNQAWIKKDMFLTAAPVNTDIGRSLMHKMGWKQGEGLGKNSEGAVNPLLLEIKTDRQGLVAAEEKPKKKGDVSKVIRKDLSGKHPVMALNELCNKKRWGKPIFEVVREDGLAHKKNFVFKVRIRNEEYIPTVTSGNKKDAKAMAATVALQKMGLLLSG